jgi:transposase
MGRSRGGLTSKIHAVVDSNGLPVRLALSPGEAHDLRLAGKLLSRLKSGSMLLGDRGYDADWVRELALKMGAWANIPPKGNRSAPICFSPVSLPRSEPCRAVLQQNQTMPSGGDTL